MTHRQSTATRRSVIGALGAVPITAGGFLVGGAGSAAADADTGSATGSGAASSSSGRPIPKDLRPGGRFDRFVAERAAAGEFSGTVLLAHRGEPVLVRSHGMADVDRSIPNRPDTIFNLASVTKSLTSVAIVQLVEAGDVAFHDTLGMYIDGFPTEIADTVTIHHMLTHTSGLGDFLADPRWQDAMPDWQSSEDMWETTMTVIRGSELEFVPGTGSRYSNSGFFLLGAIVAAVTGRSYFDSMRERVFARAGMTRTGFSTKPEVLASDDIAQPYEIQDSGEYVDVSDQHPFVGSPAGAAYSTAPDMLAFSNALLDGTLLSAAYAHLITSGKVPLPPPPGPQPGPTPPPGISSFAAYGFSTMIGGDHRTFGHGGGFPGVSTNWTSSPDLDWVSVVLANHNPPDTMAIVQLARELITGQAA